MCPTVMVNYDFSQLRQEIDNAKRDVETVRAGTSQINTRLRYNLLQWRQILAQSFSIFGDQVWAQKILGSIQYLSIIDLERRLKIEIAAQIEVGNLWGAAALTAQAALTPALQYASFIRQRQLESLQASQQARAAELEQFNIMIQSYST